MPGFLASRGEEFNQGPEMRLDRSELVCDKVLLKCKRDRESFYIDIRRGQRECPHKDNILRMAENRMYLGPHYISPGLHKLRLLDMKERNSSSCKYFHYLLSLKVKSTFYNKTSHNSGFPWWLRR